jgi:hypothetical protein
LSKSRFDKAFAAYIRRGEEKITPKTFFEVMAEVDRERAQKTIELQAKIVEGKLHFVASPDITVHGNEIVWGNQRIVVNMS